MATTLILASASVPTTSATAPTRSSPWIKNSRFVRLSATRSRDLLERRGVGWKEIELCATAGRKSRERYQIDSRGFEGTQYLPALRRFCSAPRCRNIKLTDGFCDDSSSRIVRMNLTRVAERRTSMNRPRDLTRGGLHMRSLLGLHRASLM